MKKIITISSLFLLFNIFSFGQDFTEPKIFNGYIGINYGFSIPNGDFKAQEKNKESVAYAENGTTFSAINFGYVLRDNFGFAFLLSSGVHDINRDAILKNYIDQDEMLNWTLESASYSHGNLLVGPYFSFPSKKMYVDFRALIGYQNATIPETVITRFDGDKTTKSQRKLSKDGAFAYNIGAGIRYPVLYEHLCLTFNVDYLAANHQFIIETEDPLKKIEAENKFSMLNITFGLAYLIK